MGTAQIRMGDWEFGTSSGGLAIQEDEHDRLDLESIWGKETLVLSELLLWICYLGKLVMLK